MRLVYREGEKGELEWCFEELGHRDPYDAYSPGLRRRVPEALRLLFAAGALLTRLVDDLDRPAARRTVGLGLSVFVTDEFVEEAESRLGPYVRAQLIERVLQGRSPALNAVQIRRNEHGLNLFFLEDQLGGSRLAPHELRMVRDKGFEAGLALFRCFRLRSILTEVYGEAIRQMTLASGVVLRRDYAELSGDPRIADSSQRPYLVGLTREESQARDGTLIGMFFAYTPRRFGFRRPQQEMLQRAVCGETDEELAISMGVTVSAIKKRWSEVYQRVRTVDVDLLPSDEPGGMGPTRGREMRRHLLNYLRSHPEEMEPSAP